MGKYNHSLLLHRKSSAKVRRCLLPCDGEFALLSFVRIAERFRNLTGLWADCVHSDAAAGEICGHRFRQADESSFCRTVNSRTRRPFGDYQRTPKVRGISSVGECVVNMW